MSQESFNDSLYDKLSTDDQAMINEYMPKMNAGEINSFMQRLLDHYPLENEDVEVEEDSDTVVVFEGTRIAKHRQVDDVALESFRKMFINGTKTSDDINIFFSNASNYDYVVANPEFYKLYSEAFTHIFKSFHLNRNLRGFIQNQNDLRSYVWEATAAFFTTQKTVRADFYSYLGSMIGRKLRSGLEIGYVCPHCSAYYTRVGSDKKALIQCDGCKNKFTRVGLRCPDVNCNKIVPLSSIDTKMFDVNNIKHMRALQELSKYVNEDGLSFIAQTLGATLDIVKSPFKISIAKSLKKRKLKQLKQLDEDYATDEDTATNVPELLFCLPIVCPVTSGHARRSRRVDGEVKYDNFRGCGGSFILRNGLRKVVKGDISIYRVYDQRRIRFRDISKYTSSYDEMVRAGQEFRFDSSDNATIADNKLPFEKIMQHINNYFSGAEDKKNKSMVYFSSAMKQYFEEEYTKMIEYTIQDYTSNHGALTGTDIEYVSSFQNFLNDPKLQKSLFYKNTDPMRRVGWLPSDDAKNRIRQLYISLAEEGGHVRKVEDIKLPMRFYTYRISQLHDRPKSYKTRIGVVIDNSVLPETTRSAAGYEPNATIDPSLVTVKLVSNGVTTDISAAVKNAGYWTQDNAARHQFGNRTGIIWFNGTDLGNNVWALPDGTLINNEAEVIVSFTCTSGAFSKMVQRFNLNDRLREIVEDISEEE